MPLGEVLYGSLDIEKNQNGADATEAYIERSILKQNTRIHTCMFQLIWGRFTILDSSFAMHIPCPLLFLLDFQ
jgi:hypothetical protein